MANDIVPISPGDLQPYSPSQPLAPAPSPDWGTELTNHEYTQHSGGGQQIFGQTLPAGVSLAQAMEGYKQLANVFVSDFIQLNHKASHVQAAVQWFMAAITSPPAQQRPHHRYTLFEHSKDPLFQAFANYAHDNNFSARMVSDCCWWITEAAKRLSQQPVETQPRTAPSNSSEALLNQLSDADYAKVIAINDRALANTMQVLQQRWGNYTYQQNIEIAQSYLEKLPATDQRHFDQFTSGWVHMRNSPEFIIAMFDAATGAHNIPKDGAGVAREIAECERCMKTNRKQWQADSALQARYRTLLDMRDGR